MIANTRDPPCRVAVASSEFLFLCVTLTRPLYKHPLVFASFFLFFFFFFFFVTWWCPSFFIHIEGSNEKQNVLFFSSFTSTARASRRDRRNQSQHPTLRVTSVSTERRSEAEAHYHPAGFFSEKPADTPGTCGSKDKRFRRRSKRAASGSQNAVSACAREKKEQEKRR